MESQRRGDTEGGLEGARRDGEETATVINSKMAGFASSLCRERPFYTPGYLINASPSTMHNL